MWILVIYFYFFQSIRFFALKIETIKPSVAYIPYIGIYHRATIVFKRVNLLVYDIRNPCNSLRYSLFRLVKY